MKFVGFAEFGPDQAKYNQAMTDIATNVYPRNVGQDSVSYGPMFGISSFKPTSNNRVMGCISILNTGGSIETVIGTQDSLMRYDSVSAGFVSIGSGYSTPTNQFWDMVKFADNIIVTNGVDPIKYWDTGASAEFTTLASAAPLAKYLAVSQHGFLFAGNIVIDGRIEPESVQWSANQDPFTWPEPGSLEAQQKLSDYVPLTGDTGQIMGLVPDLANASIAIFREFGISRATFTGDPPFSFDVVEGAKGTPASKSIVQDGNLCYYLGQDGFYVFDGLNSTNISFGKVSEFFNNDLDKSSYHRIIGMKDAKQSIIMWAYPSNTSTNGNPNRILIYNTQLKMFSIAEYQIEYMAPIKSFSITLEDIDTLFGPNLDEDVPISLDSPSLIGGQNVNAFFNTDHELCFPNSQALEAQIGTVEFNSNDSRRLRINMSRPIVDLGNGSLTVNIGHRTRLGDLTSWSPNSTPTSDGYCPVLVDNRYVKGRITISTGSTWNHAQGIELNIKPGANR